MLARLYKVSSLGIPSRDSRLALIDLNNRLGRQKSRGTKIIL